MPRSFKASSSLPLFRGFQSSIGRREEEVAQLLSLQYRLPDNGQENAVVFACTIPATATIQRDDDDVRITRYDFAPGAVTGWHAHGWPYFITMLTDGILRMHNGNEISDTSLSAGQAYSRPAGVQHDVMNGSDHPIAFVEIEVKRPQAIAFSC